MHNKKCSKFSGTEVAIILIIVGLIIGGILTGQSIVKQARISTALKTILLLQEDAHLFTQQYGMFPGSEASNATSWSGNFDSDNPNDASRQAWAQLRKTKLISIVGTDKTDDTSQPPNPFGGIYGFQKAPFNGSILAEALCLSNVPRAAAQAIDSELDDGIGTSGTVQATSQKTGLGAANFSPSNYLDADIFVVCIQL